MKAMSLAAFAYCVGLVVGLVVSPKPPVCPAPGSLVRHTITTRTLPMAEGIWMTEREVVDR